MNSILLDSSVIVDFLRVKDKKSTLFYNFVLQKYQIYISIITHSELFAGKSVWQTQRARNELEALFSKMQILNLDEKISEKAGYIKAAYNINLLDAIIAATALVNKLQFATLNTKDFANIKGLKLL